MPYFNRLTDIVTCNLSSILAEATDPRAALQEVLSEMQEGVAGAHRSLKTARDHETRIEQEIVEQRREIEAWDRTAREQLAAGREMEARSALVRKREATNLIAGLEQQQRAAIATREHLETTFRALEARHADAVRRLSALEKGNVGDGSPTGEADPTAPLTPSISSQIDDELAAMKRELGDSR